MNKPSNGERNDKWDAVLNAGKGISPDVPDQGGKEDAPPGYGDDGTACASFPRQRALFGLGIKIAGKPDKIVEYFDLEGEGDNTHIKIILGARKIWCLEIKGRNLLRLLYLLKERKIDWIRQADRDRQQDKELYIERLDIRDVTEQIRDKDS